jgi:uncharacterized hydrophobic protein (TIGR00271 family)
VLTHLRLTVPTDLVAAVRARLVGHEAVTNLTVVPGASVDPVGDLIECDVAKERTGDLVESLAATGLADRGGILVQTPSSTPFTAAHRLEASAPGDPEDAVIWPAVVSKAEDGAHPTVTFHVFLVIAVALAAIAVLTDSAVLVVGAMVVGPEFGAVAACCAGIVLGRWGLTWRSLRLLVLGFAFAIAVITVVAWCGYQVGFFEAGAVSQPRPNTGFIWHPDRWSFVVALLAGCAGALALAIEKSMIMVGVFISVTTVPAAGNLALALAVADGGEISGSMAQLVVNLGGMILAGTATLAFVRVAWPTVTGLAERIFGRRPAAG